MPLVVSLAGEITKNKRDRGNKSNVVSTLFLQVVESEKWSCPSAVQVVVSGKILVQGK